LLKKKKYFLTSELPDEFLQLASHILSSHSTGLIKLTSRPGGKERGQQIGSGTFVFLGTTFGILTAYHVVELLDEPCELGLTLIEAVHRVTINRQLIEIIPIAKPRVSGKGPDLAFIRIPNVKANEITNYKSFYDLDVYREEMLKKPPKRHASVWFVCGTPDELTVPDHPEAEFQKVNDYHGLCGAGGANRIYRRCGYDYVDMWVEYKGNNLPPSTFGGISGGGLWQVTYTGGAKDIRTDRYLLAGIPFAETPIEGNLRSIKCHGRKSIYQKAYKVIKELCS
jgi:hypothetical protein